MSDMLEVQNIIYSSERTVECHGSDEESGHPSVYLKISTDDNVICPYCSQEFVYATTDAKTR
jgi:uncharacterized Zn-finger protein